ncbi:MAG TPA: pyridoxal-phosphate dependent enzyme [Gemmatimonadaceae bacterium]
MSRERTLRLPTLDDISAARRRIAGLAVRTPLLRLHGDFGGADVWLKLENLQPIGSFKLRGAGNAMRRLPAAILTHGVCTASAGNMAQGVAWCAREMGVPCRVIVPDHAPRAKLDAVERLGGEVIRVPFADWWRVIETHDPGDVPGTLVHPVENDDVIAGNGTIGLEIVEDLPDVDAVMVPYGGGGLISGIGAMLRALRPSCRVLAAEVATAAPLRASLDAGTPVSITHTPSFVDGIGGRGVLPAMWPLVRQTVDDSVVVGLDEVAEAIRVLVRHARVVAEGAGAASLAAVLGGRAGGGRVVCVVSGGNLDSSLLARILSGSLP